MTDRQEVAMALEDVKVRFDELLHEARTLMREVGGDEEERARRTWLAHIEMSLSHDHHWLGGGTDHTLQDSLHELEGQEVA